jgi:hypothetical protein
MIDKLKPAPEGRSAPRSQIIARREARLRVEARRYRRYSGGDSAETTANRPRGTQVDEGSRFDVARRPTRPD